MARQPLGGLGHLILLGFKITLLIHTTLGRTPLDGGPARRRDLYLTTHNTHKRQTSMPPVGFETTISLSERQQTHVLDRAATGIGNYLIYRFVIKNAYDKRHLDSSLLLSPQHPPHFLLLFLPSLPVHFTALINQVPINSCIDVTSPRHSSEKLLSLCIFK
jgi:hypothetical protein